MRIGVDGRSLVQPSGRGIARYVRTLVAALAGAYPDDEWRVLVPEGRPDPPIAGIHLVSARVPSRVLYGLAGVAGWPKLDRLIGGVDVFWAPAPAPLALSAEVPFILSLHDLSWESRPADFTHYERLWHRVARPRALAARATRIIAVSGATREAAMARWQLPPQQIVTVKEGVALPDRLITADEIAAVRRMHSLPPRYFLYVGALEPRKAPETLTRAFGRARSAGIDADLVMVGEGRLATQLAAPGVHLLGHVDDAVLDPLYAGAVALVMPSRAEGFGLPPLEAAVRGVPSIVSDLPVFRETIGDGAMMVAVDDVAAWERALVDMATSASVRDRLSVISRERAREFAPARSAAQVHAVLTEAAHAR